MADLLALPLSTAVAAVILLFLSPFLLRFIRILNDKHNERIKVSYDFSSSNNTSLQVDKESDFPEDWWTSEKRFALEKRAIFSKVDFQLSLLPSPLTNLM